MEIQLLGPVEVRAGGRNVPAGSPQRRAVLAALAVDAGRPVPAETLIDRVWGDSPPQQVRSAIWARVTHIRHLLAEAASADETTIVSGRETTVAAQNGVARVGDTGLVLQPGGYVLLVDPNQVDLHRFRSLAAAARRPDHRDEDQAELLEQALGLWIGEPLTGVTGEWAQRMRRSWSLERLDVAVEWARTALRLGQHARVIPAIRGLTEEHPFSEPLAAVMVRALAADGRAAEALERCATVAARLVTELGTGLGPELHRLQTALLHGQPLPTLPPAPRPSRMVP